MKRIIFISAVCCTLITSNSMKAQNYMDAYRYSQDLYMGSARSSAMGSAFGALGGDFSSLSINPGGIGVYRSSEFTFTPTINLYSTNSTYIDNKTNDFGINTNVNNLGYVYTGKTGNSHGLVSITFGLGYNRLNDYHQNTTFSGVNQYSSISDYFYSNIAERYEDPNTKEIYFIGPDPNYIGSSVTDPYYIGNSRNNGSAYYEGIAFDAGLINAAFDTNIQQFVYWPDIPYGNYQQLTKTVSGRKGEWNFALGGNVSDKFYFGASLNVLSISYHNVSDYIETNDMNNSYGFTELRYHTINDVRGNGYNLKIGGIVRPVSFLRVGLALHTPTVINLNERFSTYMSCNYTGNDSKYPALYDLYTGDLTETLPDAEYTYRLITPMKAILSVGATIGKIASVDVDAEYVDYSKMKYSRGNGGYAYGSENTEIGNKMKSAINLRAGGEIHFNSFFLRAGGGYYPSPSKGSLQYMSDLISASAGLGYRNSNFFVDFAFVNYMYTQKEYPYTVNENGDGSIGLPTYTTNQFNNNRFIVSVGFKF